MSAPRYEFSVRDDVDCLVAAVCTASTPDPDATVAQVAEAVSYLSGLRLLVLDRFDVLDLTGRADALEWLDQLAADDEIDTALVFGTLKALPAGLPETIQAHWVDGGVVGQMREAA